MKCDLRDHVQRHIYFFGAYEPVESYLFKALLRPGMVVVDAGANVGQYTLIAATQVGTHGGVHSFEPVPKNFERLADNVLENGLAEVVRANMVALWHQTEMLKLYLKSNNEENLGLYTVGTLSKPAETLTCMGIRLDDYLAEKGVDRIDLVKMDIEGAEWFALKGATTLLSRCRPTMLMEINREMCSAAGYKPERIWEFLKPYGYRMWSVGNSPERCRSLSSLVGVDLANVIFHVDTLPETVTRGWSLKGILRSNSRHSGKALLADSSPRKTGGPSTADFLNTGRPVEKFSPRRFE